MSGELSPRACKVELAVGDILWMLRRLGRPPGPLTALERRTLADLERRCETCPVTAACGLYLKLASPPAEPPPFCPNAHRLRQLFGGKSDVAA